MKGAEKLHFSYEACKTLEKCGPEKNTQAAWANFGPEKNFGPDRPGPGRAYRGYFG